MRIDPVNEYRVEIELADSEMEELGISYEELDWADIETRRAIWNILGAVRENGVDLSMSGRVLIEAGKLKNGCRLCFTVLPYGGDRARFGSLIRTGGTAVLGSAEKRNIERAAAVFKNAELALYEREGAFILAVSGDYSEHELLRAGEYCSFQKSAGALTVPFLDEYFTKLCLATG